MVILRLRDPQTKVILKTIVLANLIVDTGLLVIPGLLTGTDLSFIDYFAVGTGVVDAAFDDVDLGNRVWTESVDTRAVNQNIGIWTTIIGESEANGNTLTECGLFVDDPEVGGTLFSRRTHEPILKDNSFEMVYEWHITCGTLGG